ncbi:unnamed protein product, partial [Brassica napus]
SLSKSTKKISKLDHTKIEEVFHSDGLLLCVRNRSNFVVWNPYLGQTRCIPPASRDFRFYDMFCFGYDKNNRNHKILRFCYDNDESLFCFELFDFKTSSWRLLDIEPDVDLDVYRSGVSLKGNTYFVAQTNRPGVIDVLLCFDFTTERFWRPLPFHYDAVEHVVLSCVREEKLAVLYQIENTMEIWITTKIEYDDVSWSKFLEVEMTPLNGFDYDFDTETESFFIDEDKKFAVVGGECENKPICSATRNQPTEQEETQRLLLSKETKETESFFIDEEKEVAVVYIVFEEINQSRARPIAIKPPRWIPEICECRRSSGVWT